jgi:ribonuclease HI
VELIIHVDGGARGNPGPAGAGVVIEDAAGNLLHEAGYFLGRQTNNSAEYQALIHALERVQRLAPERIRVHSDSELLVKQITGEYKVRNAQLAELYEQVQMLLIKIPRWTLKHVKRGANERADALANRAMDEKRDVIVFDAEPPNDHTTVVTRTEDARDEEPPDTALADDVPAGRAAAYRGIRVRCTASPEEGGCPAHGIGADAVTVQHELPAGWCVHAAHAILPTLLAMLNTDAQEFSAVPTLTVRCAHEGCGAVFQLSPATLGNGKVSS